MDAWDYAWVLSSELLVIILVLLVAGFNLVLFSGGQINDQSLANKFLSYHADKNPALYAQTAATKTLVVQKNNPLVASALASDIPDAPPQPQETGPVQNNNTLVAYSPDSVSELLKKQVKVYKTQPQDTLGSIARKFGISIDTIKWANNLPNNTIEKDWDLLIPQTDGLIIEAGTNTTLEDIAAKYKGNLGEIMAYNGLTDVRDINAGDYIFCKGCIVPVVTRPTPPPATTASATKKQIGISDESIPVSLAGHIFPKGYCTYFVAQHVKITFGGNARNWLANAKAAGYETTSTPAVGYVVQTTDDARYGHVALVTGVSDTHITVKEMNYVGFNKISSRTIAKTSKTIKGYIKPKY